ncbi:hypothetical protein QR680_007022 [Steinernema hermaphroditum]|uniref:Phlebovirus glycoprotein G2 fusion domain-containing protein n=1 Tax=Steinernema hermaphroditum TaxID=289476 RepID=A0AA39LYD4_9BILA|nr:hypothetical protein QR680_007022 [Steinernema hermaphroditum]
MLILVAALLCLVVTEQCAPVRPGDRVEEPVSTPPTPSTPMVTTPQSTPSRPTPTTTVASTPPSTPTTPSIRGTTTFFSTDPMSSSMTVWVSGSGTIEEEPIPLKQYYCPSSDLYMYHMRQNFERNWTQVDKTFSLKYSCTSGEPMCICTTRRCYAAVDSPNMTVEVVTLCEDPDECTQGLKARIEDPLDGSEAKLVGLNRMWRTIYTSSAQRTNGKLKDIGNEAFISNVSFLSCGECPMYIDDNDDCAEMT